MKSLNEVMKDFNKTYKEDLVHVGLPEYDYERIKFTSPRLNYMTFGGLPKGKLIEFYGEEHSGKTTTALDVVANYQHEENALKVLWIDCENTLDAVWANKLGVNVEDMILLQPTNQGAENLFQFALNAIDTGEVGLVVIDSFGVMESNQSLETDVEGKTYAGISMALTKFSKRAVGYCHKYKCTVIGLNQLRDKIGSMFGGTDTVGGRGWKHDTAVRLEFRMGSYIDESNHNLSKGAENPAGNIVQVVMKKNKTCPPTRRTGYYTLKYLTGIDYLSDLIDVALKFEIVRKSGAWFSVVDIDTGEVILEKVQGQSRLAEVLEDNVEVLRKIEQLIDERIASDETVLDDDIEE